MIPPSRPMSLGSRSFDVEHMEAPPAQAFFLEGDSGRRRCCRPSRAGISGRGRNAGRKPAILGLELFAVRPGHRRDTSRFGWMPIERSFLLPSAGWAWS